MIEYDIIYWKSSDWVSFGLEDYIILYSIRKKFV